MAELQGDIASAPWLRCGCGGWSACAFMLTSPCWRNSLAGWPLSAPLRWRPDLPAATAPRYPIPTIPMMVLSSLGALVSTSTRLERRSAVIASCGPKGATRRTRSR